MEQKPKSLKGTNQLLTRQFKIVRKLIEEGEYESAGIILEQMGFALRMRSKKGFMMNHRL